MSIYDSLNSEQKKAVMQTEGPVLILAGAGSGKTRVLTHRVCYLIDECGVNPWNIMAITFTNKAAGEMRERVDKIVGFGSESIWVTTFHSTCVRILRRFADRIGYQTNFTIYDSDDQKSLMKDICKRYQLETQSLKVRRILSSISSSKDNLVTDSEYGLSSGNDSDKIKIAKAYHEYQMSLRKNNAMDFDDLIFNTVELFKSCPDVLEYYQERFKYIMVDEYQDTNNAQFELIRLLASKYKNLCVVGDDDQSIYRFRGANIRNILDFEKVYDKAVVIKLEQNYRSTQMILDAANSVISNNRGRKSKSLWSDEGTGDKVRLERFDTAYTEASFIAEDIYKNKQNGIADYKDMAVLYRTNMQSRQLEEQFVIKGIPYNIVGGTNFYSRREIKDLLCYLKTIDNGLDDLAVKRVINVPKRGIGATTISKVQGYADEHQISFFSALSKADEIVSGKAGEKLLSFETMIRGFRARQKEGTLEALLKNIIEVIDFKTYIKSLDEDDDGSGDNSREQNVGELISKIVSYEESAEEPLLSGFLSDVALIADIDNTSEEDNKVLMMTLHSAKGLEFDNVYIAGMEEGLFPSYMTLQEEDTDPYAMEEERRLVYVGITRAKKHLTLTCAKSRMIRGELQYNNVSRFVEEIPDDLLDTEDKSGKDSFGKRKGDMPSFLDLEDYEYKAPSNRSGSSSGRGSYSSRNGAGSYGSSSYGGSKGSYGSGKSYGNSGSIDHEYGSSIYGLGRRPKAVAAPPKKRAVPNKPFIAGASNRHSNAAKLTGIDGLTKGMPVQAELDYVAGDRVEHIRYGEGTVTLIEDGARDYKVTVDFDEAGQKVMFASFAKLKKI